MIQGSLCKEPCRLLRPLPRVEAGLNTSMRVVGGDEKENLESKTVKYVGEPHGTRARE
jgi:hypothetical protein